MNLMTAPTLMPDFTIRPFMPSDYPAILAVWNATQPDYRFSLEDYRGRDELRDPRVAFGRWVAEAEGQIVGFGGYEQRIDMYHPRKFGLGIHVLPEWRGQGVSNALYDTLVAALVPRDPLSLRTYVREDRPWDLEFWQAQGYTEEMRSGGAFLDLTTFDFDAWGDAEAVMRAEGIRVRTAAELADEDPDRDAKLCGLYNVVMVDVPPRGWRTPIDVPTFVRTRLERSDYLPEGNFIAIAPDGEYVGICSVNHPTDRNPEVLATGLTGVRREWRRRGIALALKLRGLRFAKERGASRVRTSNASDNDPILTLNARLGFVREPWYLHLVKVVGEENA